jgi:hypothetical protein
LENNENGAVLDKNTPYAFTSAVPLTVKTTNTGTSGAAYVHFIAISGANPDSFELSKTRLVNEYALLAVGGSATFTVKPKDGLPAGTYSAIISVYGAWADWDRTIIPTSSFTVTFTVTG